jgi:hypothetical protein
MTRRIRNFTGKGTARIRAEIHAKQIPIDRRLPRRRPSKSPESMQRSPPKLGLTRNSRRDCLMTRPRF